MSQPPWKQDRHFSNVLDADAITAAFTLRRALLSDIALGLHNCEHALMTLESCIADKHCESHNVNNAGNCMTAQRLKRVDNIIDARLDTQLSVSDIATELELSFGYFSREFKKAVGRSPHQYIVDKRLKHARYLLRQSHHDLMFNRTHICLNSSGFD